MAHRRPGAIARHRRQMAAAARSSMQRSLQKLGMEARWSRQHHCSSPATCPHDPRVCNAL